jgi:hypothetical protein
MPDDRARHVVAELINSIFDVDKMLCLLPRMVAARLRKVSSSLWRPIKAFKFEIVANNALNSIVNSGVMDHMSQFLPNAYPVPNLNSSAVGWGGINESHRDNYFITEESDPAKLGSSLGWLLQLDGDNMRNAFLNAPWVKSVIPIRPGKEEAAINWLKVESLMVLPMLIFIIPIIPMKKT